MSYSDPKPPTKDEVLIVLKDHHKWCVGDTLRATFPEAPNRNGFPIGQGTMLTRANASSKLNIGQLYYFYWECVGQSSRKARHENIKATIENYVKNIKKIKDVISSLEDSNDSIDLLASEIVMSLGELKDLNKKEKLSFMKTKIKSCLSEDDL